MPYLVAEGGHRIELRERSNRVGTKPGLEVQLLPDLGVSPEHYQIDHRDEGWCLVPNAAGGTTLHNGEPTQEPAPLRHGDCIMAGDLALCFEDAVDLRAALEPRVFPPADARASESVRPPNPDAAAKPWRRPILIGAALVLLAGAGVAAWKAGLFGGENPSPVGAAALPSGSTETKTSGLLDGAQRSQFATKQKSDRRVAQEIAAVAASAMACGSTGFDDATDLESATLKLLNGVKGSAATKTEDTLFKVEFSPDELAGALQYLEWDSDKKLLLYRHGETIAPPRPKVPLNPEQVARQHARDIVVVYGSAALAGSEEIAGARDLDSALQLLAKGVGGSSEMGLGNARYALPDLSDSELRAAREFLAWSPLSKSLTYRYAPGERRAIYSALDPRDRFTANQLRSSILVALIKDYIRANGKPPAKLGDLPNFDHAETGFVREDGTVEDWGYTPECLDTEKLPYLYSQYPNHEGKYLLCTTKALLILSDPEAEQLLIEANTYIESKRDPLLGASPNPQE